MNCENCEKEILIRYGTGRFCDKHCARSFSTKYKRESINKKVSKTLSGRTVGEQTKEKLKSNWKIRKTKIRNPNSNRTPLVILLTENSTYTTQIVKRRILQENVLEYKCTKCPNNGTHNNKPLTLQLHHKDGNNKNHLLANLEFLCPNCHSQTDTYAGKGNLKRNDLTFRKIPCII